MWFFFFFFLLPSVFLNVVLFFLCNGGDRWNLGHMCGLFGDVCGIYVNMDLIEDGTLVVVMVILFSMVPNA
jgi:hypothetical protein